MKMHMLPKISIAKVKKRVGRGIGSGKGGHTSGRGTKGQRSRVGSSIPLWFEGGQLPLTKKLPYLRGKLRFSSLKTRPQLVTLDQLEKLSGEVTIAVLHKHGMLRTVRQSAKIVAVGTLTKKLSIVGISASATAKKAVESVGGSFA